MRRLKGSLNAEYRISNLDADLSSPDADLSMMSRHTIFQHVEIRSGEKHEIITAGRGVSTVNHIYTGSETALAYEQDKTYKITVLHTNDHHGHFGAMNMANMVWRRKTLVDGIRKEVAAEGGKRAATFRWRH